MNDYELLTVVLMILGIIVSIPIAYINHTKKVTALAMLLDRMVKKMGLERSGVSPAAGGKIFIMF